jgi:hypothetical protein
MFKSLIFDKNFIEFLQFANRDHIIAQIICNGQLDNHLKDEGNYISSVPGENDMISFLPKSKYEKVEDPWKEGRVKIKIGRFIKKFFSEFSISNWNINDVEIERFVNFYKSFFSNDNSKLEVVTGDDISKYYLEDNYYTLNGLCYGTLWNSCMRQRERNVFMKLYDKNPNIKMLVLFSDEGKVKARALLWESGVIEESTGIEWKIMDRIYTFYDHDIDTLKNWAKENGYIYKWRQDAKSELFFSIDGKKKILRLKLDLDCNGLDYYPYLDTFKFMKINLNSNNNTFSNSDCYRYDYILTSSRGELPNNSDEDDDLDELTWDFDENQ